MKKHSQKDDEILNQQKEAAISILKESAMYEKTVELVIDDSYNSRLLEKIVQVEEKID